MKKILFIFFLFQTVSGFSQSQTPSSPAVISSKTLGYVNGIRLDSVDAEYGQFRWGFETLFFEFGQLGGRKKTMVTNSNGTPLTFSNQNTPFILNFFYFNGWQLAQPYYDEKTVYFILKKRENK